MKRQFAEEGGGIPAVKRSLSSTFLTAFEAVAKYLFSFGIILLSALTIVVLFNVTRRYVFRSPVQWGEELVMALTATMIMVGLPYCFKTGAFLRVDVVVERFHRKMRGAVEIANSGIASIFLFVLTFYAARLTLTIYSRGIHFYMLGPPEWPLYLMFPLGLGTLGIACFIYCLRAIQNWRSR